MLVDLAGAVVAYLVGAFPTSYLMGRLVKGIDIRQHGSGNAGATNTARVVGTGPGLVVLLVDIGKGWGPVACLAPWVQHGGGWLSGETAQALFGFCAVCGHLWSPWLGFQGGKGVATATGVLLGLAPPVAGLAAVVWLAVAATTRYVSVSSIAAVTVVPVLMALTARPLSWVMVSAVLCVLIVAKHRVNLVRLLRHEESRLGRQKVN